MKTKNLIRAEARFVKEIGISLSLPASSEKRRILDMMYEEYGGVVGFANAYMRKLIKAIKKGKMSLMGFDFQHADVYSVLLSSETLDSNLQMELSGLLYGADERRCYFQDGFCLSLEKSAVGLPIRIFLIKNRN